LVVVANVISKAFSSYIINSKKLIKLRRDRIKIARLDFALITAHLKPRTCFRRVGKVLIQPKKGITADALNSHSFKVMNNPSRTKRTTCKRNMLSR
jgi:hypothetical protein